MINGFTAAQHPNQAKCEVCDCVISYPDFLMTKDLHYTVCSSFNCRRLMKQKSSMAPLLFKAHLKFNNRLIHQTREREAARKKHIEEVKDRERREHRYIFQNILHKHSELTEENTRIVVIPSSFTKSAVSPDTRINRYAEHLNNIVTEAASYSNASEVAYDEHHDAYRKRQLVDQRLNQIPMLRTISDKLCCMCKGGCCISGKEHAYLSVFTIRRYMDNNPDLSTEQILELYLSKISSESINDSCINHTEKGCMLPRYLRSDICNGYYCDSLKSYQKQMEGKENPANIIVIKRSNTYWNRFEPGVSNKIIKVSVLSNL